MPGQGDKERTEQDALEKIMELPISPTGEEGRGKITGREKQ